MITGTTKLLGVMGYPVEHSLSPVMHNAALTQMNLDFAYLPFPIAPVNLEIAIAGFATMGIVGLSVTIPHKQAIMTLLDHISDLALGVGAVNTVTRQNHQWVGTNTDVEGFISPLQTTYQRDWSDARALIIGNGGAARAVVVGCNQLGIKKIDVVGRNIFKLKEFREGWGNSSFAEHLQVHNWDGLPELLPHANLLVNTTPVGMHPHVDVSPLSNDDIGLVAKDTVAYDLIYTPSPTKFLSDAQTAGIVAIDGLEMLVQQGVAALKIWLERDDIPVDVMRKALRQRLFGK